VLRMNKISQQLVSLVFVCLLFFGVGVASLIGFQSYNDLEDVAFERVEGAAKLYASEFKASIQRIYNSLSDIDNNQVISEQLSILTNYGPLYSEDPTGIGAAIPDSDTSFYLQSQLKLVRAMLHLLAVNNLSQLSIYHTDPFQQFKISQPLPALIIDQNFIWLFRYNEKSVTSEVTLYKVAIEQLNFDEEVFDVSSVYQENADYFYQSLGLVKADGLPHDYYTQLNRPKIFAAGQAINAQQGKLNVAIWSPLLLSLVNPENWLDSLHQGAIVVGIVKPNQKELSEVAERLGTQVAIVDDERAWVSSLAGQTENFARHGHSMTINEASYLFSEIDIDLASDQGDVFRILALSSTQGLKQKTITLIVRLILISLVAILVTGISIYMLVGRTLRKPLDLLLEGVKGIQGGKQNVRVAIDTKNELATLGMSFNEMANQIQHQSRQLQAANESLESKVRERTTDLENAQEQLILAEKMASIGQLVAGIAHEINTPIGNTITALSFNADAHNSVKEKFDNKKLASADFSEFLEVTSESMELMRANLKKASELVQTFKNVAVNQSVEEVVEFSVAEHLHEVMVTLRPQLKQSQVNIEMDVEQGLMVKSYPGAYYHIISNMFVNSLRHAFPDKRGNIRIYIHKEGDSLHLHYQDDGVGMDDLTRSKIFDPFFTTKRGQGGTGLGLYMTYNIVTQRLGGNITVCSEPGKGTQFDIVVPFDLPETDEHASHFSRV